jgi:hypothetical protein
MSRRIGIFIAAGLLLFGPAALGQVTMLWQSPGAAKDKPESERSMPIVIHAASAPLPVLKYQLLPPYIERRPGNAAVWWNRIPAEQTTFFNAFNKAGGTWVQVEKWMDVPLGESREKELRPKADQISNPAIFADMQHAARFESCDWELPMHEGSVISLRLPELQQTRMFGRMLSAKARLEISERKYDEAVRTMQTGFALARDVAKGPTLIHALVGTAICTMMTDRIREMIQQPDSPNLYWALSTLPRPVIDFRPGFDAEACTLYLELPELRDLDKKQLPPEQWRELLLKLVATLRQWGSGGSSGWASETDPLLMTGLSLQGYPRAKQYFVEHGRSAAEVEAMPVAQVIVLYTLRVYDEVRDEQFKSLFLPYREASKGLATVRRTFDEARQREIIPIASMLLPAVQACKQAETRTAWFVARLRIVEAMRLYAAAHGRLPDRLEEISDVPVPQSPYDEKSFSYKCEGNKAILGCEEGPPNLPWRYEITLVSQGK